MAAKAKPSFDQIPLFNPDSPWKPPTELPDLSQETEIAIDTETRDDKLADSKGPGFYAYERSNPNTGFICGISVSWREQSIYIPMRHYGEPACFDHQLIRRWLTDLAKQNHTRFVFHNFGYDWGWIYAQFKINPPALIDDTMAMASMVNENLASFTLDDLCKWQGLPGKDEALLIEAARGYKVKAEDVKKHIWQLPSRFIGPYAEQDAASTLKLAQKLRPILAEENLETAYQVERDLLPITLRMKQRGVRVDVSRTEELSSKIFARCDEELFELSEAIGEGVNIKSIRSNRWMRGQFERLNLEYPRTAASDTYSDGQASFEKSFMSNHPHWFPRTAHKIKHQYDVAHKFLQKFILTYKLKDRVYPTVNQFRSEGGGARSHRFSYSDPPLQQTPSRDDEWAPLVRSCYIPEDGERWCSIDYRQQEFRLIVFVSELMFSTGARKAANRYRTEPNVDFHDYVAQLTRLGRKRAKDTNFATAYGAGVKKFSLMTGMSEEEAKKTMDIYNKELPFIKETAEKYARYAAKHGFIKLIDGARNHFNMWEPRYRDFAREWEFKQKNDKIDTFPCLEEEALRRKEDKDHPWYGEPIKRSYTHKAFNRMIQGSAARQIKKAMVDIDKAGYQPVLQIHDELCFSLSNEKQAREIAKIMEEAMPVITIPMLTDVKLGSSWGQLEK